MCLLMEHDYPQKVNRSSVFFSNKADPVVLEAQCLSFDAGPLDRLVEEWIQVQCLRKVLPPPSPSSVAAIRCLCY